MDKKNNHILMIISALGLFAIALFAPQLTQSQQVNPNTISSSSTSISSTTTIPTTSTSSTTSLTSTTTIVPIATSTTNRWLGYSIGFGGNTTYITANWTVANITSGSMIQWVGIQGISGRLVQVGISEDSSGLPNAYHIFYERYPNEDMMPSFNVSVGDKITASIAKNPSNSTEWNLYLKDLTTNQTLSKTVEYNVSSGEPIWIIEAPYWNSLSSSLPMADFNSANFNNVSSIINGAVQNLCNKNLVVYAINTSSSVINDCSSFNVSNVV